MRRTFAQRAREAEGRTAGERSPAVGRAKFRGYGTISSPSSGTWIQPPKASSTTLVSWKSKTGGGLSRTRASAPTPARWRESPDLLDRGVERRFALEAFPLVGESELFGDLRSGNEHRLVHQQPGAPREAHQRIRGPARRRHHRRAPTGFEAVGPGLRAARRAGCLRARPGSFGSRSSRLPPRAPRRAAAARAPAMPRSRGARGRAPRPASARGLPSRADRPSRSASRRPLEPGAVAQVVEPHGVLRQEAAEEDGIRLRNRNARSAQRVRRAATRVHQHHAIPEPDRDAGPQARSVFAGAARSRRDDRQGAEAPRLQRAHPGCDLVEPPRRAGGQPAGDGHREHERRSPPAAGRAQKRSVTSLRLPGPGLPYGARV